MWVLVFIYQSSLFHFFLWDQLLTIMLLYLCCQLALATKDRILPFSINRQILIKERWKEEQLHNCTIHPIINRNWLTICMLVQFHAVGLCSAVSNLSGIPLLLIGDRIVDRLGYARVTSLVLLTFSLRMAGYSFIRYA